MSHYEICLGNAEGECDEIDYVFVGLNTMYTFSDLELRQNREYYVTVKVSNMVGLSSQAISNSVKIDLSPPEPVNHMKGSSANFNSVCNSLFESCKEESSLGG